MREHVNELFAATFIFSVANLPDKKQDIRTSHELLSNVFMPSKKMYTKCFIHFSYRDISSVVCEYTEISSKSS